MIDEDLAVRENNIRQASERIAGHTVAISAATVSVAVAKNKKETNAARAKLAGLKVAKKLEEKEVAKLTKQMRALEKSRASRKSHD